VVNKLVLRIFNSMVIDAHIKKGTSIDPDDMSQSC